MIKNSGPSEAMWQDFLKNPKTREVAGPLSSMYRALDCLVWLFCFVCFIFLLVPQKCFWSSSVSVLNLAPSATLASPSVLSCWWWQPLAITWLTSLPSTLLTAQPPPRGSCPAEQRVWCLYFHWGYVESWLSSPEWPRLVTDSSEPRDRRWAWPEPPYSFSIRQFLSAAPS